MADGPPVSAPPVPAPSVPATAGPHVIVFANEKGGTGKSTTAVHVAIALAAKGARVACFDLDHRQRTVGRYLDNRAATIKRTGSALPMPVHDTHDGVHEEVFEEKWHRLSQGAEQSHRQHGGKGLSRECPWPRGSRRSREPEKGASALRHERERLHCLRP